MTGQELSSYINKVVDFINKISYGQTFLLSKICQENNRTLFLEIFRSFSGWQFYYNESTDVIGRHDKESIDFIMSIRSKPQRTKPRR